MELKRSGGMPPIQAEPFDFNAQNIIWLGSALPPMDYIPPKRQNKPLTYD